MRPTNKTTAKLVMLPEWREFHALAFAGESLAKIDAQRTERNKRMHQSRDWCAC